MRFIAGGGLNDNLYSIHIGIMVASVERGWRNCNISIRYSRDTNIDRIIYTDLWRNWQTHPTVNRTPKGL